MRILLIGADRDPACLIANELRVNKYQVDLTSDVPTGKHLLEANSYPVVIVCHRSPDIDGVEMCRAIRAAKRPTLVLMLASPGECSVFDGFSAGIDRYLALPIDTREVTARVNALARRAGLRGRQSARQDCRLVAGDIVVNLESKEVRRQGRFINVTVSEFLILQFMMEHKNQVVTREEIACGIWGADTNDRARKLPVHVNNLRDKLTGGEGNAGIYTVSRRGYLMVDKV